MKFWSRDRELIALVESFRSKLSTETFDAILELIRQNESPIALETLCSWIYDLDVEVDQERQDEIVRLSEQFRVDGGYLAFIGLRPPYPDRRSPEQQALNDLVAACKSNPTPECIETMARNGFRIDAIRLHRLFFGSTLEEAERAVRAIVV